MTDLSQVLDQGLFDVCIGWQRSQNATDAAHAASRAVLELRQRSLRVPAMHARAAIRFFFFPKASLAMCP